VSIQKNRSAAVNPQAETMSHHLLERMQAIAWQTMLATIASMSVVEASL
jgi:hypothetical protein